MRLHLIGRDSRVCCHSGGGTQCTLRSHTQSLRLTDSCLGQQRLVHTHRHTLQKKILSYIVFTLCLQHNIDVLCYIVFIVLFCAHWVMLCYNVLHCTVLYCVVLCYIVLYCIHCVILCYIGLIFGLDCLHCEHCVILC